MEPPSDHRTGTARMRHREDDSLVFPRRPNENLTLDIDSNRQARVFADNVNSGGDLNMYTNGKGSNNNARIFIIGGFCCFVFLLATISIYTSLNQQQENLDLRSGDRNDIEDEMLNEDEKVIEEAEAEIGDADDKDCDGEGGEGMSMFGLFNKPPLVEEVIIITEIEATDGEDSLEESVVEEAADLSDATVMKDDKEIFVMEVNGMEFEIGISKDGDFDLPDGLILNPRVREHWLLIEKTLGLEENNEEDSESGGDGPEKDLEAPTVEDDSMEKVDNVELSGSEQPVRMPEGLLFDAPPVNSEHEHGEGCDPISVDVGSSMEELTAGDKVLEEEESKNAK